MICLISLDDAISFLVNLSEISASSATGTNLNGMLNIMWIVLMTRINILEIDIANI